MQPDKLLLSNEPFFAEVTRMLSEGSSVTLRAKGNSMYPFIADGRDSVVLQKAEKVAAGDIVLAYVAGKGHVLHRVYKIEGEWLTLMGDGNLHVTERCRKTDVAGKAVSILRNGRSVECSSPCEHIKALCWKKLLPLRRCLLFLLRSLHKQTHPSCR